MTTAGKKIALAGAALGVVILALRRKAPAAAVQTGVIYDPRQGQCGVYDERGELVWFSCTSRADGESFARSVGYLPPDDAGR